MASLGRAAPVALAILALAGCGPAEGQRAGDPAAPDRPDETAANTLPADEYARRAAIIDQFEIQSGRLALQKSEREDIRALGRMLVDDHIRASARQREAIEMNREVAPPPLDGTHRTKLRQLQTARGQQFDNLFLDVQQGMHEEALALHRGYARNGDNAALRAAAAEFAGLVRKHLDEVERIRGTRSAPPPRG